jgi:hypothetical protein
MIFQKHNLEYRKNLQISDFDLFNQALNEYEKNNATRNFYFGYTEISNTTVLDHKFGFNGLCIDPYE